MKVEIDPFADDVLERLVQSNHHYQRSHGHYIVPLAQRLLDARAVLAEITRERDRAVKEARAAVPLINAKVRERDQWKDEARRWQNHAALQDARVAEYDLSDLPTRNDVLARVAQLEAALREIVALDKHTERLGFAQGIALRGLEP